MNKQSESTLRFKTSKKKMLLLVAGAGVFVAIGWKLLASMPVMGWISIVFFGLCGSVGLVGLLPGSSYIELTTQGFLICNLYKKWFIHWSDVREFYPIKIHRNSMVGWNYQPGFQAHGIGREKGRKLSFALSGVEAAVPDTYGMKAAELAALMNEWREKYSR